MLSRCLRLREGLGLREPLQAHLRGGSSYIVRTKRALSTTDSAGTQTRHPFYDDSVERYASRPLHPVTLQQLLTFARGEDARERRLASAAYAQGELPVRLAMRVKDMQSLPYIVGTNPYVRSVYQLYLDSFHRLRTLSPILNEADDANFTHILTELTTSHADVIPKLAKGMLECRKYVAMEKMRAFLDRKIHARIAIRVIAEHHIALHDPRDGYCGIVNMRLNPREVTKRCVDLASEICSFNYGAVPEVVIQGDTEAVFPYIPVHLEYMMFELIKNAMRATVENHEQMLKSGSSSLSSSSSSSSTSPSPSSSSSSFSSSSSPSTIATSASSASNVPKIFVTIAMAKKSICIRIRDRGGGVSDQDMDRIFDYAYSTVGKYEASGSGSENVMGQMSKLAVNNSVGGPMAGLGFGLPMARIYAQLHSGIEATNFPDPIPQSQGDWFLHSYFGGSLNLYSLRGHGCDVFLRLNHINDSEDLKNIEI